MSFLKIALIILAVFLLVPANGEQRAAFYTTVQRTIADIGGFCGRNPDVCDNVSSAFDGLLQKLESAAHSVEDMLHEAGIGARRDYDRGEYPGYHYDHETNRSYRSSFRSDTTSSMSADTLTSDDRTPAWHGPGGT